MFLYDPLGVLLVFTAGMAMVFISHFMPAPDAPTAAWSNLTKRKFWIPIWKQKSLYSPIGWKLNISGWGLVSAAAIIKIFLVFA